MIDAVLSMIVVAVAVVIGVLAGRVRNQRVGKTVALIPAACCLIALLAMVLSDWPLETLDVFWAEHSVLAGLLSSMLPLATAFFLYEYGAIRHEEQLAEGLTGAGFGGIVDSLIDLEVAVALYGSGTKPEACSDKWSEWKSETKPLRWLRADRHLLAAEKTDPRRLALAAEIESDGWGGVLLDQATRKVVATMRDWTPLISKSTEGTEALLALSHIRQALMHLRSGNGGSAEIENLRLRLRLLARYCEDRSKAPDPRPELRKDLGGLSNQPPGLEELKLSRSVEARLVPVYKKLQRGE